MNGTVVLEWSADPGANACGRDTIFMLFIGVSSTSMNWVANLSTTQYSDIFIWLTQLGIQQYYQILFTTGLLKLLMD